MTIQELFAYVDNIKPNVFDEQTKIVWLNEIEARVQEEILLRWRGERTLYRWPEDKEASPILDPPEDAVYRHWLEAQIDYSNGEYSKYQATAARFNQAWSDFAARFATRWHPADGYTARWEDGVR